MQVAALPFNGPAHHDTPLCVLGEVGDENVLLIAEDVLPHFEALHEVELPAQVHGAGQVHLLHLLVVYVGRCVEPGDLDVKRICNVYDVLTSAASEVRYALGAFVSVEVDK